MTGMKEGKGNIAGDGRHDLLFQPHRKPVRKMPLILKILDMVAHNCNPDMQQEDCHQFLGSTGFIMSSRLAQSTL